MILEINALIFAAFTALASFSISASIATVNLLPASIFLGFVMYGMRGIGGSAVSDFTFPVAVIGMSILRCIFTSA